jgi:hypothetical protein
MRLSPLRVKKWLTQNKPNKISANNLQKLDFKMQLSLGVYEHCAPIIKVAL